MESRMLGNLLVRFGWGLFVIVDKKTNPINKTQIIYPYINKATKLAFLFNDLDKQYQGTAIFNKNYDTLDINGKLINTKKIILSESIVKKNFDYFDNKQYWQTPPMFSAIKIKGQKMYDLARKKHYVEIPPRQVKISNLKLISYDIQKQEAKFQVNVSKGTYIRSLRASKRPKYRVI
ncbi:MAG: hypothetical protein Q8764_02825 [Pigeon pea little leaf phytoplasma]|uniref:tRNA pseudouridine(55) synthase n=1 Tax=Candidatus Phytoplasma fabacearum TaxID=2982628 RepID=A0ABU8ZTA9_9MOLU|nr:hypothetical protein ['Bituminaria bituminosa' little leaf phytoplasma]MDV3149096.1 hypothetical protein [Pigeon pea little leaf phytoplasma]MDO7983847.1 hypothetical protein ['Bituminaria bituminosa' little leaf phytoplasma]MDO8024107.1 hypothetical protein ['Bituminaria bituminosa' little leaf phytoplasma]MDV3154362.1 hypothetical protein [Pigeon pea little leaf phytoplasma]MDV3158384.1 hypothetical protein [Pigeon pea little leaf phytoplasma]